MMEHKSQPPLFRTLIIVFLGQYRFYFFYVTLALHSNDGDVELLSEEDPKQLQL